MPISHEIKSQLAKLLATEDIIVENRSVETAQFNVETRVLTLPLWDRASNSVYDLLVGHEVGHALFTPNVDPPKEVPHSVFNIVEDARIEKLMKRRYPGLSKSFFKGYKELSDRDFFCISGEDISKMSLPDRVNLYFKIGSHVGISFDNSEKPIVQMIAECETFEDAIAATRKLYEFCESKDQEKSSVPSSHNKSSESSEGSDSTKTEENGINPASGDADGNNSNDAPKKGGGFSQTSTHTVESLEEKLKDLNRDNSSDNVYVEIPDVNLDTVIVSNSDIHKECLRYENASKQRMIDYCKEHDVSPWNIYESADSEFMSFKKSAQKEVNYLVKEFECKKAADSYARASISRTGVLDCSKLHTYKYNEDLFKKVTTLSDGKNHGLVFVLDWSGSMSNVLLDTIKQLYNLIWFCKKVSIPFEVYAFTNEWNKMEYSSEYGRYIALDMSPHYERENGLICVDDCFSMLNLLTSKVNSKELQTQMINIWRIASYFTLRQSNYSIPDKLSLSGTPLNEALITLHNILPKFSKETGVQKVQCIVLTDGEAGPLARHVLVDRPWEDEPYLGQRKIPNDRGYLRNRKTGTTLNFGEGYFHEFTDTLLKDLKGSFPNVNFIGIRVLPPREANGFIRQYYSYGSDSYDKIISDWKRNRSFCITRSGYHAYFGMSSTTLSQNSDFDINDGATKGQIKSAFIKSLKTKKLNKKVLGEFISLVV